MDPTPESPRKKSLRSYKTYHRAMRRLARGGRRYALPWLSIRRWVTRLKFVGAAFLAAFIAILFAIGADLAIAFHADLMRDNPNLTLVVAPLGFALIAWVSRRWFPGAQGSGIPQAIAATHTSDRRVQKRLLSLKIAIAKVFLTLSGLLCGASIGREGPTVQVGASILGMIANKRTKRIANTHDLIIAGGGAGVAAAFNTPLGGIMFAIEELCRYRPFRANSTVLIAVVLAGVMSLAVLGNYTYFGRTGASLSLSDAILPVIVCGIAGGVLGGVFCRILIASSRRLPGFIGVLSNRHPVLFAGLCGLATALIGLASGGMTYGTGYAESKAALEGAAVLPAWFMVAKLAVIWLALLSRIPGGVFAPALAVGIGMGANLSTLLPADFAAATLVLGIVGFLSGMMQAPITCFVIVLEMTANHQMMLPLMATAVIANAVSRGVAPISLYHALSITTLRKANEDVRKHDEARRLKKARRHSSDGTQGADSGATNPSPLPPTDGDGTAARTTDTPATPALPPLPVRSAEPPQDGIGSAPPDKDADRH